jgi:hypothetical protein
MVNKIFNNNKKFKRYLKEFKHFKSNKKFDSCFVFSNFKVRVTNYKSDRMLARLKKCR